MPVELKNDEPLSDGIHRIAEEMVDAMIEIVRHEQDTEEAIHKFRKGCKEIRALLRLVRNTLGKTHYHFENTFYRDLARPLSKRRDRWVFIETIDEVLLPGNDALSGLFQTARGNLLADYKGRYAERRPDEFANIAEELADAKGRIAEWPINDDFSAIEKGIHRIYLEGQNAMAAATADSDPETRHKWRKLVKYLWYQLRILSPIAPEVLEDAALDWYELSSLLGVDHDLTELFKTLSSDPELAGDRDNLGTIEKVIAIYQEEFEAQIYTLGERLYLDDADTFVDRLGSYWVAARG